MSTDAEFGIIRLHEDFTGVKVVADKPEWGVDTDPAVEIVTNADSSGVGGVVRVTMDAGQSNVGGLNIGGLQWSAYDNYLLFQVRVKLSALGAASERIFVGLTDVQEDTLTEQPFTGATTVLSGSGNPDDAIGFFYEGDMTGSYFAPAAVKADAVTVGAAVSAQTATERGLAPVVAGEWVTLGMRIENAAKNVVFTVNGKTVYTYKSTVGVISDVALIPCFVVTEGTTAINFDVDYIHLEMGRDN